MKPSLQREILLCGLTVCFLLGSCRAATPVIRTPTGAQPALTETPGKPTSVQDQGLFMFTPTSSNLSDPQIITDYASLPAGQYLVYYEFRNNETVNAIGTDGKIYGLFSISENLGFISPNGRIFSFPDFAYDYIRKKNIDFPLIEGYSYRSTSPDGKMLAGRGKDNTIVIRSLGQDWMRVEGSESESYGIAFPVWSPDGKQIAYDICHGGQIVQEDSGIYIADVETCLNGATQCKITPKGPYLKGSCLAYIAWSPDGQYLAGSDGRLRTVDVKTKQEKTIVDLEVGAGPLHGIAWSPDGQWIGYSKDHTGLDSENASIYIVPAQGGKSVLLNSNSKSQIWAWLNVIPRFKVENEYKISIMGEGMVLRGEPSSSSTVNKTLHQGEKVKIVDGPVSVGDQTWWKIQSGTKIGWVIENYDWFTLK